MDSVENIFLNIRYFSPDEFFCPGMMSRLLLDRLDYARSLAGIPFRITSSYRTADMNKECNGSANSAHLRGLAVDISCHNAEDRFKIVQSCLRAGFRRIGIAKTFIHVDVDDTLPHPVMWLY